MNTNLLPMLNENLTVNDGSYIQSLSFCKKNSCTGKCKEFYLSLKGKSDGYYSCPYGLSIYQKNRLNGCVIYNGFRERGTYSKVKSKNIKEDALIYNPILGRTQCNDLIAISEDVFKLALSSEDKIKQTNELIHEVRKLNAQIKNICETIWTDFPRDNEISTIDGAKEKKLFQDIRSISACSTIAFSRFSMFDYINNPTAFHMSSKVQIPIYKKFDKMRIILRNYMRKNVSITFEGNSRSEYSLLPSFEIVPFLLLENAAKYSSKNDEVKVIFKEIEGTLNIDIRSYGPYCNEDEIGNLCQKYYRGKNAEQIENGYGLGLYFVNELCNIHNIKMEISSEDSSTMLNKVPYGIFNVRLIFN